MFCASLRPLSLFLFFFFNDTATTEIYTLSLHDALPIFDEQQVSRPRQRSEERAHPGPPEPSQPVEKEQRLRPEHDSQTNPAPASDRGFPRGPDVCGAQEQHG